MRTLLLQVNSKFCGTAYFVPRQVLRNGLGLERQNPLMDPVMSIFCIFEQAYEGRN